MDKEQQRLELKERRQGIEPLQRQILSDRLCSVIMEHPMMERYQNILMYQSIQTEISLEHTIAELLQTDKKISLPKVFGTKMNFHTISSESQLISGAFQIMEPDPQECQILDPKEGICFIPGLGFDRKGGRIGYGKGFYDRYLSSHSSLIRVGCCYSQQIVPYVVQDRFDVVMDYLVTPDGWIDCKKERRDHE